MSTEECFCIGNRNKHVVRVPIAIANELFGILNMDAVFDIVKQIHGDMEAGDEDQAEDAEELKVEDLEYSDRVLDVVQEYALLPPIDRTSNIPRPLTQDLKSVVSAAAMDLVTAAEKNDYLVDLLNCSMFLRCDQLTALCAAYMAMRIDEIAKGAPDIMAGAQRIRDFMHMENEWTPEEMVYLREEMNYAKSVDPNVY
ncbi:hypothetical protein ABB37_07010 [Leptomonas pyrrhocoris]|uniref:SKP1 component dimerisation domain-containing protein n=1 Tax=Leptomonas pyrrhocoris TaxID=157538 RepID=A0A0M9FWT0_LEPPY|nr:hypothetical protein ABB37_07010 [Leptomonas pyrrhocoris]XP_015656104.1 hypothetical protein ABB37_07010 [Leptomonas pyrrhocoris]XP_015656105.1 hypothetical protein ABB37_07010 [Leptomonas pyrrhocoris]KPA77664.1 hypothetical protein ABB37_07010 [Leptomonas pyrrhocoris]KPA77665.1 hypothetical protein ABB37_07010 [Leptomonas pyrrhocoris]KPA77666.1 hypothetical protein ABB37_07010 [Leptomonas pyrrhocoris]|eukprot:XP_015656103.1 hypothetical protein ABB37_07010 [Leptomonas pyrrhocoris]